MIGLTQTMRTNIRDTLHNKRFPTTPWLPSTFTFLSVHHSVVQWTSRISISYLAPPLLLLLNGQQLDNVLMLDFFQDLDIVGISLWCVNYCYQLLTVSPQILSSGLPAVSCGSAGWRFSLPPSLHCVCSRPSMQIFIIINQYQGWVCITWNTAPVAPLPRTEVVHQT